MTMIFPDRFKQALPAGFDGLFNWDFLKPAFAGTKIEPMDIDAVVERKGNFLVFETKGAGTDIPLGQQITLENLVVLGKGRIHVMIIYGKTVTDITEMEEWYFASGLCKKKNRVYCDSDYVLARVSEWFRWVNR